MTPAHIAVENEDLPELRRLLDAGADVQDPDEFGTTLLHRAVDAESDRTAQTGGPLHVDMTALLLAHGADPSARDGKGQTPRDWAVSQRHWLAQELFDAWEQRRR
jgi:uncharacterized protein